MSVAAEDKTSAPDAPEAATVRRPGDRVCVITDDGCIVLFDEAVRGHDQSVERQKLLCFDTAQYRLNITTDNYAVNVYAGGVKDTYPRSITVHRRWEGPALLSGTASTAELGMSWADVTRAGTTVSFAVGRWAIAHSHASESWLASHHIVQLYRTADEQWRVRMLRNLY